MDWACPQKGTRQHHQDSTRGKSERGEGQKSHHGGQGSKNGNNFKGGLEHLPEDGDRSTGLENPRYCPARQRRRLTGSKK